MTSCRRIQSTLVDARDRSLGFDELTEVTAHCQACDACREFRAREDDLALALSDLRHDATIQPVPEGIAARALQEAASRRERPEVPLRRLAMAAAVSGLLLLTAVTLRLDDVPSTGRQVATAGPVDVRPIAAPRPSAPPLLYSNGRLELIAAPSTPQAQPEPEAPVAYLVEEWDL